MSVVLPIAGRLGGRGRNRGRKSSKGSGAGGSRGARGVGLNPFLFKPDWDVSQLMLTERDKHMGSETLTLYSMPSYVLTSVERIAVSVDSDSRPGQSALLACCMTGGLWEISSHPSVMKLLELRDELSRIDGPDADDIDTLSAWFRRFELSTPDGTVASKGKTSILVPSKLRNDLNEFRIRLGVTLSSLALYAVFVTLGHQREVLAEHRAKMKGNLVKFVKLVKRRERMANKLLEILNDEDDYDDDELEDW